jgi:hypothetical protein
MATIGATELSSAIRRRPQPIDDVRRLTTFVRRFA